MKSLLQITITLSFAAFLFLFSACDEGPVSPPDDNDTYNAQVVINWNDKFLEIEKDADGYRPMPATRALAYLGLSAYEACITGIPDLRSVAGNYAGLVIPPAPTDVSLYWPVVVNASYGYLMPKFFPQNIVEIADFEAQHNTIYQQETTAAILDASQQYGRAVAAAVWDWSKAGDVGHDYYLDPYIGAPWELEPSNFYTWRPTPPAPAQPMFSHWGEARTFAIADSMRLCPAPGLYGGTVADQCYAGYLDIYAYSLNGGINAEEKWMAEFWSDDFLHVTFSIGSRWLAIANQVYKKEEITLAKALYANVKLGLALNDAGVACFYSKYHYKIASPRQGIRDTFDANWDIPLQNPLPGGVVPFFSYPAYPSEHATLAGAAAEVLTDIFGTTYAMTDTCHATATLFNGTPRSFESFYQMAEECASSRAAAGTNTLLDLQQGISLGYRCGRKVNELDWSN